jgi:hypothetical protein
MADPVTTRYQLAFARSPICQTVPASGAFGSATSDGSISLQFFLDRQMPPKTLSIEVTGQATNVVGQEGGATPQNPHLLREVLAEVVLTPSAAYGVSEQIKTMLQQMGINLAVLDVQLKAAQAQRSTEQKP